jgi:hypothetical protein
MLAAPDDGWAESNPRIAEETAMSQLWIRPALVASVLWLTACTMAPPPQAVPPPPQPAQRAEVVSPQPAPAYVWIPGHHTWRASDQAYVWVPGYWTVPPPGHVWVPGHWTTSPTGHFWIDSYWRRT